MGFFSKIGGFLSDSASSIIGAGAGLLGGAQQASSARDAADKQMQFQREMSDTAYQRTMKDMRKAGLNPILAYKQGGASTPSGASYNPPNIGAAAVDGATRAATSAASVQNLRVTNQNLMQQNSNLKADEAYTVQNARRLQLENEAYAQLSPEMRAIVLSGGGVSSAAAAAGNVVKGAGRLGMQLRSIGNRALNSAKSIPGDVLKRVKGLFK